MASSSHTTCTLHLASEGTAQPARTAQCIAPQCTAAQPSPAAFSAATAQQSHSKAQQSRSTAIAQPRSPPVHSGGRARHVPHRQPGCSDRFRHQEGAPALQCCSQVVPSIVLVGIFVLLTFPPAVVEAACRERLLI